MRALGQFLLTILVISGWFVAMLWMVFSVSQIAVERATDYRIPPGCSTQEVSACLP